MRKKQGEPFFSLTGTINTAPPLIQFSSDLISRYCCCCFACCVPTLAAKRFSSFDFINLPTSRSLCVNPPLLAELPHHLGVIGNKYDIFLLRALHQQQEQQLVLEVPHLERLAPLFLYIPSHNYAHTHTHTERLLL